MKRWWNASRSRRKFARSPLAVASLTVIAAYVALAMSIAILGWITLDDTLERVGPGNVPGFFLSASPEKRLEDCEFLLETAGQALRAADPATALRAIRLGAQSAADLAPAEVESRLTDAWSVYDRLAGVDQLNDDSQYSEALKSLENITAGIFPEPRGLAAWRRNLELLLGTDRQGRSIAIRGIYSIKVAVQVGLVTALLSVSIGSLLGCAAGYYGGWVDHLVTWLYTTFSSIPGLVLLVLLAHMFSGTLLDGTLVPVYVAFCLTFWVGPCRIVRGETLKIRELEYVQAARAIGFNQAYILLRHILPNTFHLMLINFSLLFIGAIKSEVILSFLGLGVKEGPSWGIMISQAAAEVINGFFWQIGAATVMMFVLVLAFNIFSDSLQDALDPKHVGDV
jgi:peptide/nickel transport system permease protein